MEVAGALAVPPPALPHEGEGRLGARSRREFHGKARVTNKLDKKRRGDGTEKTRDSMNAVIGYTHGRGGRVSD